MPKIRYLHKTREGISSIYPKKSGDILQNMNFSRYYRNRGKFIYGFDPNIIIILLLSLSIIPGCSKGDDNTVSEAAEKVVDAMFTAPNPKLFTSETATVIGEGISEKEQSEQKEEIEKNWEDLLGKYFEMGRLEYFISTYGQQFLFEADSEEKEIYVKEIELVDQTDTSETVLVKYMDGEKEKEEKIYFQYDQDGLIRDVYPLKN